MDKQLNCAWSIKCGERPFFGDCDYSPLVVLPGLAANS
jgi:hypothetical protein